MVSLRQRAKKRAQRETGEQRQQSPFAVEIIEEKAGGDAGHARADGVGGNDQPELAGADAHDLHVLRPQRQDDQEIQHRRKLDARQQSQQRPFFARI